MPNVPLIHKKTNTREYPNNEEFIEKLKTGEYHLEADKMIDVIKDGERSQAKPEELANFLNEGWQLTPDKILFEEKERKAISGPLGQTYAAGLGFADMMSLGMSDYALVKSGIADKAYLDAIREENPISGMLGMGLGGLASVIGAGGPAATATKAATSTGIKTTAIEQIGAKLANLIPGVAATKVAEKAGQKIVGDRLKEGFVRSALKMGTIAGTDLSLYEFGSTLSEEMIDRHYAAEAGEINTNFFKDVLYSLTPATEAAGKGFVKGFAFGAPLGYAAKGVEKTGLKIAEKLHEARLKTWGDVTNTLAQEKYIEAYAKDAAIEKVYRHISPEKKAKLIKQDATFGKKILKSVEKESLLDKVDTPLSEIYEPFPLWKSLTNTAKRFKDKISVAKDNANKIMNNALTSLDTSFLLSKMKAFKGDYPPLIREKLTSPADISKWLKENIIPKIEKKAEFKEFRNALNDFIENNLQYANKDFPNDINRAFNSPLRPTDLKALRVSVDRLDKMDSFGKKGFHRAISTEIRDYLNDRVKLTMGEVVDFVKRNEKDVRNLMRNSRKSDDFINERINSIINSKMIYERGSEIYSSASRWEDLLSHKYESWLNKLGVSWGKVLTSGAGSLYFQSLPGVLVSTALAYSGDKIKVKLFDSMLKNQNSVSELVAKSIKKLTSVGTGRGLKTAKGITLANIGMEKLDKSRKKILIEKIEELANNNEMAMDIYSNSNQVGEMLAPETTAIGGSNFIKKINFLNSKLPVNPNLHSFEEWQPNRTDLEKFERYLNASMNPKSILNEISQGYVSKESLETLKTLYPSLHEGIKVNLLDLFTSDPKLYRKLDNKTKRTVQLIMEMNLDGQTDPSYVQKLQTINNSGLQQDERSNKVNLKTEEGERSATGLSKTIYKK